MRLVIIAAFVCFATPALAGGNTWDKALKPNTEASKKKTKRGTPPAGLSHYDKLVWTGDYYAKQLAKTRRKFVSKRSRQLLFDTALNAYEKALEARPKSAEAHLRMAELIYAGYNDGGPRSARGSKPVSGHSWRRRAIKHWVAFEKLAPTDARLADVVWPTRAIEYTKLETAEGLRNAVRDYTSLCETQLDTVGAREAGRLTSNRAELHMMQGQLTEAIVWYRRALEYRSDASWAFGLAVAYDRDGQGLRAQDTMRKWVSESSARGFNSAVNRGDTFFVPEGEVHYYFALIHQATGNYDLAIRSFQQFIRSGAHRPFHARARENIRALRAKLKKRGRPAVSPRHWSRTWQSDRDGY